MTQRCVRAALVCLAVLVAIPTAGQQAPMVKFEKYTLSNGLDVILHEDHATPVVTVNVWYHVGSGNEKPGRTGFAHLYEHMMFQGSENWNDEYFKPLQRVGGQANGSTNTDRTNYWENVPSNYLELALWLEADRMGYLLPTMTQEKLDNQRDVVKNERRQSYENQPYNKAWLLLAEMMYPDEHPYSWPTIGSQEDLSAASMEDVQDFFKSYYTPNNASLVIAGDLDIEATKKLVEKYFGPIPPGPAVDRMTRWVPGMPGPMRAVAQDDVKLSRLYLAWHSAPFYAPGDAELDLLANVLASGKSSRLYRELVYERQIAQDVQAFQQSREMGSSFMVVVTARENTDLGELERSVEGILTEMLRDGITEDELVQARTAWEASFVRRMDTVGGFGGIADQLNTYNTYLGDPDRFSWDLDRYSKAEVGGVMKVARATLDPDKRVTLAIVPRGELARAEAELDRSVMPGAGAEPTFAPPAIQRAELANGLDVLVVEDHGLPLVQAMLIVGSGWSSDPAERPGVASLTSELLDEGTTTRSSLDIAAEAKRLAARLDTGSFFDASVVSLDVLRSKLEGGMTLMADVVLAPTFPGEELERQRAIYMGRIQQESKQPQIAGIRMFQRVLFGDTHPYGQPFTGSGTTASVQAITRDDLAAFYRNHYHANNAALVMAGDITLADAVAVAEAKFGAWPRGEAAEPRLPELEAAGNRVVIVDRPGAPQSMVLVGHVGPTRADPDYLAIEAMNNALGGKFTSRINMNLREDKGYTYGARSMFASFKHSGLFLVMAPVQTEVTAPALAEIVRELRDVTGERPVSETELVEARDNLVKGFPQRFERLGGIANQMAEIVIYGLPDDEWQRYMDGVTALSTDSTAAAAKHHIHPDGLTVVVVGDREKIQPAVEALGLGQVEVRNAGDLL